jgi:hypothetical protein
MVQVNSWLLQISMIFSMDAASLLLPLLLDLDCHFQSYGYSLELAGLFQLRYVRPFSPRSPWGNPMGRSSDLGNGVSPRRAIRWDWDKLLIIVCHSHLTPMHPKSISQVRLPHYRLSFPPRLP